MGYDGMRGSGVRRARWPPPGGGGGARGAVADGSCRAMPGAGASRARACMIMHGPPTPIHPYPPPTPQITQFGPRRPPDPPELGGSSGEFDPTRFRSNSFHCNRTGIRPFLKDEPFSAFPVTNKNFLRPKAAASQCRPPLWAPGVPGPRVLGGGWGWMGAGAPQERNFYQFLLPDRPGGLTLKGILAPRGQTMPRPGNKRPVCFHLGQWSAPGGRKSN